MRTSVAFLSLATFDHIGGIQTFNKYIFKALLESRTKFQVLSLHDSTEANNQHISCFQSNKFSYVMEIWKRFRAGDVIICGHVSLAIFCLLMRAMSYRNKTILICHGTEIWGKPLSFIKRYPLRYFHQIWAVSNFTKEKLGELDATLLQNVVVFPNCIELKMQSSTPNPFLDDRFNILSIMRLEERKLGAFFDITAALSRMSERDKKAIRFTVIGSGSEENRLRRYVEKNKLSDSVELMGYVEDTAAFLEHCDVFALINDGEGFGIVYLEAMEFKKCCISSTNCGATDVVLHETTGLNVPPNDPLEAARAISRLMSDSAYRLALGEAGFVHLHHNYTFPSFVTRLEKNLTDLEL